MWGELLHVGELDDDDDDGGGDAATADANGRRRNMYVCTEVRLQRHSEEVAI